MERRSRLGRWGTMLLWGLVSFPGCSFVGGSGNGDRPTAKAETVFVEAGHPMTACLHPDVARSHTEVPDSVLFFDRDSKIVATPPTKKGAVKYHLHLLHRVGDQTLDFLVKQDAKNGHIELDLSRFDQPEELLVVSDGRRIVEDESATRGAPDGRREEIPTPPYVLSFRLLPAEGRIETILSLQRHRWEIETESGKVTLVTGSPNRRDHLLTFFDPSKAHLTLVAEDPYVYVPALDGAIPPRLTVEVQTAGPERRVWQKAATYHMPDGIARAGETPFLFRTSKRDLIAFGPAPRADLELPKDPAGTSAIVQVVPSGLSEKDVLKVFLACVYPSGPKGETAAWVKSCALAGPSGAQTAAIDLGHLDASLFPLTSALAMRSVLPWKLTAGLYAPEPPLGKASVPLAAPAGKPPGYSKFLSPKYASHYDFLRFLGSGSGAKKGSGLLDSYLRNTGPDDPNVTPPPPQPGPGSGPGVGGGTQPPPGPNGGGGIGGLGGGQDSYCGCGKNGAHCPNAAAPCRGTCGQGCPANGCCDADGNLDGGTFLVTFPCPPKGMSCGQNEQDCSCPPHQWDGATLSAAVTAAINANKFLKDRLEDMNPPNPPIGFGPCHQSSHAADILVSFWKNPPTPIGGPSLAKYHVTYHVNVIFTPCIGKPPSKPGGLIQPVVPNIIVPGSPGGTPQSFANVPISMGTPTGSSTATSFTGGISIGVIDPINPITTSPNPAIDPNTIVDVALATNALNGGTSTNQAGVSTNSMFAAILHLDVDTLLGIQSAFCAMGAATSSAWLGRPISAMNGPDSWDLSLPTTQWAAYQPGTGGTGTTPPPPTPTPPPPSPPPPGPSKSIPRR
jgi:hypothetical protein